MGRFANVSAVSGLDFPDDGRAVAIVDWDQDGDQDVWFRSRTAPRLRLMRNRSRDLRPQQNYVSFRLVGTTCNRDAIGARVELDLDKSEASKRFVKTVTAGDAFLSQSSRWLHFGLGSRDNTVVDKITVHWPGGTAEVFDGVKVGARHILRQGAGRAEALSLRTAVQLSPAPMTLPRRTAAARIVLPGKVPFPQFALSESAAMSPGGESLLVMLWSSTCPVCRTELKQLGEAKREFQNAKLGVLAVYLDGLDAVPSKAIGKRDAAAAFLQEIRFPFDSATTTSESLAAVQYLQHSLFDMYPDFVVPTSFLLDEQRSLVAIYRGAVEPGVLLRDAKLSRESNANLRNFAVPFVGSWFTKPASNSEIAEIVGRRMFKQSPDEGIRFYEHAIEQASEPARKRELAQHLVSTHIKLARQLPPHIDVERAIRHYREAIRHASPTAALHHEFGVLLAGQGLLTEAEQQFREALRLRPNSATAKQSLDGVRRKLSPGAD